MTESLGSFVYTSFTDSKYLAAAPRGIPVSIADDICRLFDENWRLFHPFLGLETEHQRSSFCCELCTQGQSFKAAKVLALADFEQWSSKIIIGGYIGCGFVLSSL